MSRALPEGAKLSSRFKASRDEAEAECKTRAMLEHTPPTIRSSGHATSVSYKVPNVSGKPINPWLNKTLHFSWGAVVEAALTQMHRRFDSQIIPKSRALYEANSHRTASTDTASDASSVTASVGSLESPASVASPVASGSSRCAVKLFSNFEDLTGFLDAATVLSEEKCAYLQRVHGVDAAEFALLTPLQQQIKFLVYAGLGRALALSYFFEEEDAHRGNFAVVYDEETLASSEVVKSYRVVRIDFDRSAFGVVGQDDLAGPRKALGMAVHADAHKTYKIHLEDIENFPDLRHQNPWYWPTIYRTIASANCYSKDVVEAMKALKDDKLFQEQVFDAWAQIALTDDSDWHKDIMRHMPECDKSKGLAERLHQHFSSRRLALFKALVQSPGYNRWWYALDKAKVRTLCSRMELYADNLKPRWATHATNMDLARQHYWVMGCNIAKKSFEEGIYHLERLIQGMPQLRDNAQKDPLAIRLIDKTFDALLTIRQVYHEHYTPLFNLAKKKLKTEERAQQDISPEDIDKFVVLSDNTLRDVLDVCGKRVNKSGQVSAKRSTTELQLTDGLNTDLLHMTEHFSKGIHNLRRCQYLTGNIKPTLAGGRWGVASIFYRPEEAEFVLVSKRATPAELLAALIEMTITRLQQVTNKQAIIKVYYKHMQRHERANTGLIAGAYRLFNSYYGGKATHRVHADYGRLQASDSGDALTRELNRALSVGDWGEDSFNAKFVLDLLRQQQKIIAYSNVVGQVRHGLVRAELACLNLPVIANNAKAAEAFRNALQYTIDDRLYAGTKTRAVLDEAGWQEVEKGRPVAAP
ncbi:MAG: hypothetical protein P1U63_04255 [Coxiellaceae bacterium]|nr:hypothetical protein [Coxiellaceae bacterium]